MKKNVLVIDNCDISGCLIQEVLDGLDINCHIVKSGEHGLSYLRNNDVDIIVLETRLPDMSNIEIIKSLKQIKPIPVVVQTTQCYQDNIEAAFASGCDYFLKKPIEVSLLEDVIKKCLV